MGVRVASSRHLDVVVMAPALTEAGQSQNFKIPPTSHSSPVSPLGVLNGISKFSVSKLIKNGLYSKVGQTVTKLIDSGKCDTQGLNGTNKCNEETDSISLDRLATLAIASELLKVGKHLQTANTDTSLQAGDTIMNNCETFMEDQDINMGIQSTTPVPSLESANVKEKNLANDMDQLFKNLGAVISNDIGGGGDLGQNVDELLQVIKSMESNTPEADPTIFRHMEGSESEEMFPTDGSDLGGGLSSFERVLFNDEEVMDLCGNENLVENSIAVQNKEIVVTKERIVDCQKIQFELERKCDWLVRRLRKLQGRAMGKHIGEELTGFLELTHSMIEDKRKGMPASVDLSEIASASASAHGPSDSERVVVKSEHKLKGISSSAMSCMIQRLDLVSHQQSSAAARRHLRHFQSGQPPSSPAVIPKFDNNTRHELQQVSSQLHTQLKMIESAIDSDATASSSGGDSCDEMQSFNNQHQIQLTISKRAAWKWSRDRAAIAGRWTWLQAQISDLEYRIRQHNEIHRQLRLSKGQVILGDHPVSAASTTRTSVVNGFHGVLPGASPPVKPRAETLNGTVLGGSLAPTSPPCSRVRPLNRAMFRKRKLLQGAGLHLASKKAAKPATTRCKCILQEKLDNPCLLCTGRLDPTVGLMTDVMTLPERMAVLDPTLHPVLSFHDEVRETVHYAGEMQSMESQQKILQTSLKSLKIPAIRDDAIDLQERRNYKLEHQNKYKARLKKNILNNMQHKIRVRPSQAKLGRKPKGHYDTNNHTVQRLNKGQMRGAIGVGFNEHRYSAEYPEEGGRGSRHPSPEPGHISSECLREKFAKERRKRENSYDIDNIIIPRSYSSAARVEIITYKEIPTPKWRLVDGDLELEETKSDKDKDVVGRSSVDSDLEDYSDEAIAVRHEKCLADEKKKFSMCIKLPAFMRGRGQRRTDSLAESSGANTPDPMSPANMLDQGRESCSGSPMGSPPATPQPATMDNDSNLSQPQSTQSRRRTISTSRWVREKDEYVRSVSPDNTPEVAPFEQRSFPIPDEVMDRILKSRPEEQVTQPIIEEPKKLIPRPLPMIDELLDDDSMGVESRPVSPVSAGSDSTDSLLGEGDDPNDPEWTSRQDNSIKR